MFNYNYGAYQVPNQYNSYQQLQQQPFQQYQQSPSSLNGQVVADVEVAKGMNIPLDGTISYFPSADGKSIFTKQLALNGTVELKEYKLANSNDDKGEYITKEEFLKFKKSIESKLGGKEIDEQ